MLLIMSYTHNILRINLSIHHADITLLIALIIINLFGTIVQRHQPRSDAQCARHHTFPRLVGSAGNGSHSQNVNTKSFMK